MTTVTAGTVVVVVGVVGSARSDHPPTAVTTAITPTVMPDRR